MLEHFFLLHFSVSQFVFTSSPATFLSILSSPHFSPHSPKAQLLPACPVHQQSCWIWWDGPAVRAV